MKMLFLTLLLIGSPASGEIYTWKDNKGTAHYTNSLHEIPSRYLSRTKVLDIASGKQLELSNSQQTSQPATANTVAAGSVAPANNTPRGDRVKTRRSKHSDDE